MKNAHLRLAEIEYSAQSKTGPTRARGVWCNQIATDAGTTHMLSVFGNDAEMGAICAAISSNLPLTARLPDGVVLNLNMGEKPTTYRRPIPIPGRPRPVRHALSFSNALVLNGAAGSVTVLHNEDALVWATVISFLGLPARPEWASAGVKMFRDTEKISEITGFNCSPVTVTVTREELLLWIGEQVERGLLTIPEEEGPVIWPVYGIKDLLRRSFGDDDAHAIAA